MNIFVTSICPITSARFLDDKRVVKMILEAAQMLSTALRYHGLNVGYKATHANHPCNVWARQSRANWYWLYTHAVALCEEYTRRYSKVHKSQDLILELLSYQDLLPAGPRTPFVNCAANKSAGVDFKDVDNVFVAYRYYLYARWELDKRPATCKL